MARRDNPSPLDLPRQVMVTAGWLFLAAAAIKTAAVPSLTGVLAPIQRSLSFLRPLPPRAMMQGWLAPEMTLLSPAAEVWWVWPVVLLGMLGYTIWQWRGDHGDDPRYRGSGWWLALAMILTGGFPWVVEAGQTWLCVGVLVAATLAALMGVRELTGDSASRSLATTLFSGLGPEILLGSLLGALSWAVAGVLSATRSPLLGLGGQLIGLVALLAYVVVAGMLIRFLGPRLVVALSLAWWLGCVAWGRIVGHPRAQILGWGSAAATIMVLFLTIGSLIHVTSD